MSRTETLAPPSDPAIESAVLGAMLLERDAVGTALALLRGNDAVFYPPAHQAIFRAIAALHGRGSAVDVLTVVQFLREKGHLNQAGGAVAVAELTSRVQSAAHLSTHCVVLLELYTKRRIADVGRQLLASAYDPMNDPHELLGLAQNGLNTLHESLQIRRAATVGELFDSVVDEIVQSTSSPDGITGVPTGLAGLDKITGGWQPGDLIIIAARPGMGKTSLMVATGRNAARQGHGGLIASLEMGARQLVKKLIATELGYTTSALTKGVTATGRMDADEAESIRTRAAELKKIGLVIDDTPGLSIGELRAKATKAVQEHGITWLAVDYLQLMRGDQKGNREQEISSISRGLKLIAKELHIPVIAAAQLSRATEQRGGDKRPQLSDLRESGAIEQDADVVLFPHRPEYYGLTQDSEGNSTAGITELIIAKHRNGSTATGDDAVVVYSNMATGRYRDREEDAPFTVPYANARQLPASEFDSPTEKPPF